MEQWSDIPSLDGYQASTLGRIRSLDRVVKCRGGHRTVRGQILTAFISASTGYFQVAIFKKRHSVHRLVALTWCYGFFDGAMVDHKSGDRADNRSDNLQWVTPSENVLRGYRMGRVNPYTGKFGADHSASKAVIATCLATGAERRYDAAMEAVREGFDSSSISRCCAGKIKTHKGHTWRFMNERAAA